MTFFFFFFFGARLTRWVLSSSFGMFYVASLNGAAALCLATNFDCLLQRHSLVICTTCLESAKRIQIQSSRIYFDRTEPQKESPRGFTCPLLGKVFTASPDLHPPHWGKKKSTFFTSYHLVNLDKFPENLHFQGKFRVEKAFCEGMHFKQNFDTTVFFFLAFAIPQITKQCFPTKQQHNLKKGTWIAKENHCIDARTVHELFMFSPPHCFRTPPRHMELRTVHYNTHARTHTHIVQDPIKAISW